MIDIREHGGGYGGSKYKKGYKLSLDEISIKALSELTMVTYEASKRIDCVETDSDLSIWAGGYYTNTGVRYIEKLVPSATAGAINYSASVSFSPSTSFNPQSIRTHKDSLYVYVKTGNSLLCYLKNGIFVKSLDGVYFFCVSLDGSKVYSYNGSTNKLMVFSPDLNIISEWGLTGSTYQNEALFIGNRYFVYRLNASKYARYDMENLPAWVESSANVTDTISNQVTVREDNISPVIDGVWYHYTGRILKAFDFSTMNKIQTVTTNLGSSDNIVAIRDGKKTKPSDIELIVAPSGGLRNIRYVSKSNLAEVRYPKCTASMLDSFYALTYDKYTSSWVYTVGSTAWHIRRLPSEITIG